MIFRKFALAAAALAVLAAAASPAEARRYHHRWHSHWYGLPYHISYLHNYGPGPDAGTFAYYDGPSSNHCIQGAAAYWGQRGRHPCF